MGERHIKIIILVYYILTLNAQFISIRFDAMAEKMRGAVLDSTFMGEHCTVQRQGPNRKIYRVPANVEKFDIKVGKE